MNQDRIYVAGELYLSLETIAEIYQIEVVWLRQVVGAGLLEGSALTEPTAAIAAVRLDRVATIVRLHRVLGFDVEAIRFALENALQA